MKMSISTFITPDELKDTIHPVCEKYSEVAFAYLFGSYATGEQTKMSDIDIAIYLKKNAEFNFHKRLLFQGDCCRVLRRNDIDILVLNNTKNLILLQEIITRGTLIYNKNQDFLDTFETRTLHSVFDFTERNCWEKSL